MNSRLTRRQYVAAVTAAAIASASGCTDRVDAGLSGETGGDGPETDAHELEWTTHRGDAARSGVRPSESGPGASLSVAWELEVADLLEELEGLEADEYALEKPLDDSGSGARTTTETGISNVVLSGSVVAWTIGYSWIDRTAEEEEEKFRLRIVAADRETGAIRWSRELGTPEESRRHDWFAPEVGDAGIYVPHRNDDGIELLVHDPDTGELAEGFALELPHEIGQPLVADGTIYVVETDDGESRVRAFDAGDGESEWAVHHSTGAGFDRGIPGVTVRDGTVWSFDPGSTSGEEPAFVARDATDGSVRFREPLELPEPTVTGMDTAHLSSPTFASDSGYAAGDVDSLQLRDRAPLVSFDPADGSERWQYEPPAVDFAGRTISAVYGLPVVVDGLVLATRIGDPDSMDGTSGGEDESGGEGEDRDGSADEDKNENGNGNENYIFFAIDEADGTVEWTVDLPAPAYAPVAAGDVIYVPLPNAVYAISTSGERLDRLGKVGLRSGDYPPAIGDGRLFTATIDSIVAIE
ncbi:PQQ-binding-like beta-propeller repeat protein [Halomontanus rarus]|uniref:outer membrane protein assembly factor BamB family protein n=1 Tax=Halomontanus rarus TaxID=3034020 RepID=UPI001A98E5A2